MRTSNNAQIIGIPISSIMYPFDQRSPLALLAQHHTTDHFPIDTSSAMKTSRVDSMVNKPNKIGKKAEIVSRLKLGARILRFRGVEKIFKNLFCVKEGDRLLKASQCYLSTTSGPISGILFISTHKIAFCSHKSIKLSSPNGDTIRFLYKIVIPVSKIERVNEHDHRMKTSQKYIEIATVDNFEFWFTDFLNLQKALKYLQQSVSQS